MKYNSFVYTNLLKTIISIGTLTLTALLLLNPTMYSTIISTTKPVNANFLSNEYEDIYIANDVTLLQWTSEIVDLTTHEIITYEVKKWDLIQDIARKYTLSVEQIKRVNNLIEDELLIGQRLYLTSMDGFIYIVKEESISLMVFANLYTIDKELLLESNNQTNELAPYLNWQIIFVPKKSLEEAYAASLLVKPQPRPRPQEVIVSVPKNNTTKNNSSINSRVATPKSSYTKLTNPTTKASTTISSARYVFQERNGMAQGHCTYYAAHKANFAFPEIWPGAVFRGITGNANQRLGNAKKNGFRTSSTPTVWAIAVFANGGSRYYSYGHVAIVEEVDWTNKRIKVSDMNYAGLWIMTVRRINLNDTMTQTVWWQSLLGFIPEQPLPQQLQAAYQQARR